MKLEFNRSQLDLRARILMMGSRLSDKGVSTPFSSRVTRHFIDRAAITLIFQREAFNAVATENTYLMLIGYIGTLLTLQMGVVIMNTYYAFQDTKTFV